MEFISKGCKLSCAEPVSSGTQTFLQLYGLYSVPEMGGSPQMVDVTNLNDSHKRYIHGILDTGSLEFEFYATKDETDTSTVIYDTYNTLLEYQMDGTVLDWKLEYPDGTGYTWSGRANVRKQQIGVNDAIKFTLNTSLDTELEPIIES